MDFSKLKAYERRIGAKTFDQMFDALTEICAFFTPAKVKWSCISGQFCGIAKMHRVYVHAAFRISVWQKYAASGVLLSRAV